jgi:hypothetical protein
MYNFDKEFHTTNKNYIEERLKFYIDYTPLYPSVSNIKFNNTEYRFNIDYFYKKYTINYNWLPNEKHTRQLLDNQYTLCTKIQSIEDINKLCDEFNIQP